MPLILELKCPTCNEECSVCFDDGSMLSARTGTYKWTCDKCNEEVATQLESKSGTDCHECDGSMRIARFVQP
jgi:hypothetical protein